jgi:ATP-dependent exoDNAse (exonuclease V) alpha subunit
MQRVNLPKDPGSGGKTFTRTQIPLTYAFALSDHKVQGKGLAKSILDLQKPPTGHFAVENYYTMLSRTSEWEDMAILLPFKDDIFTAKPDKRLMEYDLYLEK